MSAFLSALRPRRTIPWQGDKWMPFNGTSSAAIISTCKKINRMIIFITIFIFNTDKHWLSLLPERATFSSPCPTRWDNSHAPRGMKILEHRHVSPRRRWLYQDWICPDYKIINQIMYLFIMSNLTLIPDPHKNASPRLTCSLVGPICATPETRRDPHFQYRYHPNGWIWRP